MIGPGSDKNQLKLCFAVLFFVIHDYMGNICTLTGQEAKIYCALLITRYFGLYAKFGDTIAFLCFISLQSGSLGKNSNFKSSTGALFSANFQMIVRHVKKNKIPSTILFKLVAHSSTEDLIIVVVDWVDEPKPDKGAFFLFLFYNFSFTSTLSSQRADPLACHGQKQRVADGGL